MSQQRYELCKLLATLLLFSAAFSEAVGVTGGPAQLKEAAGNVLCAFSPSPSCNLGKPPIHPCAKKCRSQTCSADFTLLKDQLWEDVPFSRRQFSSCNAQLAEVVFRRTRGL